MQGQPGKNKIIYVTAFIQCSFRILIINIFENVNHYPDWRGVWIYRQLPEVQTVQLICLPPSPQRTAWLSENQDHLSSPFECGIILGFLGPNHFTICRSHSQNYVNQLLYNQETPAFCNTKLCISVFSLHTQVFVPFLPERPSNTSEGLCKSTLCITAPCITSSQEATYMFTIFRII